MELPHWIPVDVIDLRNHMSEQEKAFWIYSHKKAQDIWNNDNKPVLWDATGSNVIIDFFEYCTTYANQCILDFRASDEI